MNPLSVLALILSLAALGVAISGGGPSSSQEPTEAALRREGDDHPPSLRTQDQLEARIRRLEKQMQTLVLANEKLLGGAGIAQKPRRQTSTVGGALADTQTEGSSEVPSEGSATQEKMSVLVADEIRKFEKQRWEDRRTRFAQAQEERLAELADAAGLTSTQKAKLSQMLAAEREEIGALVERARTDMSWRETRREARAVRARTDENASALLDEDQLEQYQNMRDEEPYAGRGFRGPRREGGD